jgi:hypothetical protein
MFPKQQISVGPTQVFRFHAASQGEAQIEIPHNVHVRIANGAVPKDPNPDFAVTIQVYEQPKTVTTARAAILLFADQVPHLT